MGRGKRGGIDKDKNGMRAACVVEGVLQSTKMTERTIAPRFEAQADEK